MYSESLAVSVAAIAVVIAKGKSAEELEILASVLIQLGDTLTTIACARGNCE